MSQLERQQKILGILREMEPQRSISVKELAAMFYSSESSIRRDIIAMEKRGLITHIYGGVMLAQYKNSVMPANIRDSENFAAKEQVAAVAADMIKSGDTIFLDSSSTSRRILKYVTGNKKNIRVITNNLRIFSDYEKTGIQLYCTGGTYNPQNHNFLGHAAESYIKRTSADVVFFSSIGLSHAGEINDVSEEETSMRSVMLSRARRKVFLCDSSKIGISKFITLCNISEVDDVVCDKPELIEEIRKNQE